MVTIEHVMQLITTPWDRLKEAVEAGLVDFNGEWCAICRHIGMDRHKCPVNPDCYGECCEEWQAAYTAFSWLLTNKYEHKALVEYKERTKDLLGKLVMIQLGNPAALVLVSDCWEDVYKMRTSMYVSSILSKCVYVCGVSLSETEKAIAEMPNFTLHAPGADFKAGLLYDVKEALIAEEKEEVNK
jgi:hypothetical protein